MSKSILSDYNESLRNRLKLLIDSSGLEVSGFAEFTNVTEAHLYAMLNGNRRINIAYVQKVNSICNVETWQFFDLNFVVRAKHLNKEKLTKFKTEHRGVPSYFKNYDPKRSLKTYIETVLLPKKIFKTPIAVKQIKPYFKDFKPIPQSKAISQTLNHLVNIGVLKKKTGPIIKQDGSSGNRAVDYFYR